MTRRQRRVLPGMPPTTVVMRLEAMDEEFRELTPRCFLGVLLVSSLFAASPEDDIAVFIIDKTTLPACTRICWGGVGVVQAPIADKSLAGGLFRPSPSSGICTTGATRWRGGRAGIPSFLAVSIALAMVWGCVFCDGRSYSRRVYAKYGTTIWGQNSQIFGQTQGEK